MIQRYNTTIAIAAVLLGASLLGLGSPASAALGVGYGADGPHGATVNGSDHYTYQFSFDVSAAEGEDELILHAGFANASGDAIAPHTGLDYRPEDADASSFSSLGDGPVEGFEAKVNETLAEGSYVMEVTTRVPNLDGEHTSWLELTAESPSGGSRTQTLYDVTFDISQQDLILETPDVPAPATPGLEVRASPSGTKSVETLTVETAGGDAEMSPQGDGSHLATVSTCDSSTFSINVTYQDGGWLNFPAEGGYAVDAPSLGASFQTSPSSGPEVDETVQFYDESTQAGSCPVTAREWTFGDGNEATGRNPVHAYVEPGTYEVTLTVTGAHGNTSSVTKQVTVTQEDTDDDRDRGSSTSASTSSSTTQSQADDPSSITAAFSWTPTEPRIGESIRFNDESTAEDPLDDWWWRFGDGSSSSERNPTHTFAEPGPHEVEFTVADEDGNTATVSRTVEVAPGPLADVVFTEAPSTASIGVETTFNAEPRDAQGNARDDRVAYSLDAGPGSVNPRTGVYTSATPGTAVLNATVQGDDGTDVWTTTTVTVVEPGPLETAVADCTDPATIGSEVTCTLEKAADAQGNDVPLRAVSWTIVDRTNATIVSGEGPTFSFTVPPDQDPGTLVALADVEDEEGHEVRARTISSLTPPPVPPKTAFEVTCRGLNCSVDATDSTAEEGSIEAYLWTVDGENVAEGETATLSFDEDGIHEITLTVTDSNGQTDQATRTVSLQPAEEAAGDRSNRSQETDDAPGLGLVFSLVVLAVAALGSRMKS